MINLDIKWSDPVQIEKNGDVTFQREWVIDPIYLNQFFAYWKVNKLELKSKGYGVVKREQNWVLTQTNDNPTLFKDPKKPKQKVDAAVLWGKIPEKYKDADGRTKFAGWLTDTDNRQFARAIANRMWKQKKSNF